MSMVVEHDSELRWIESRPDHHGHRPRLRVDICIQTGELRRLRVHLRNWSEKSCHAGEQKRQPALTKTLGTFDFKTPFVVGIAADSDRRCGVLRYYISLPSERLYYVIWLYE